MVSFSQRITTKEMSMKRISLMLLAIMLLAVPAFASNEGMPLPTGTDLVGFYQGASTTVASGTVIIPSTGYTLVSKTIGEGVGTVCTLAAGRVGQLLVIVAGTVTGSDTAVITPATKTGFSTVTLATAKQSVTLLYVNDTYGWIIIGTAGNPTVA